MAEKWPKWLKDLMAAKRLNNKGLAALIKASGSTVGNWLDGGKPEAPMIFKLAELSGETPVRVFSIIYGLTGEDDGITGNRDAEVEALIDQIMQLPPDDRTALRGIVEVMLRRWGKGDRDG